MLRADTNSARVDLPWRLKTVFRPASDNLPRLMFLPTREQPPHWRTFIRHLATSVIVTIIACVPSVNSPATTTTSASEDPSPATSMSGPTTSGPIVSTGPADPSDSSDTTQAQLFIMEPDGGPGPVDCDSLAQDCPEGEKCAPWNADGGTDWNGTKCVMVIGDGAPGEPCTAPDGKFGGIDDCAAGSFCWNVDRNNLGTCVAQCTGDTDSPLCPPNFKCQVGQNFNINLCFPS